MARLKKGERRCALAGCDEAFVPTRKTQVYHSRNCALAADRQRSKSARAAAAPAETVECALEGCTERFLPRRSNHKFCTTKHAQEAVNRRRGNRFVPAADEDVYEAAHRKDIEDRHRLELKKNTSLEARIRRYETVLSECLTAYEPTKLLVKRPTASKGLPIHEMILATGDWHTGQKTKIHETGGVYEQDIETTRTQVFKLWDRVERLHEIESAGIDFKKLHILGLGDLIEGDDMRPSQHRQVEDIMTVQTIQAFDLFTWLVRQALTRFETVEVDMVGGNHDRTGRQKGNAGLAELDYADTMSWLIGEFTKRLFENEPRVKVTNWNTFFGYKLVAGHRVVFEHGSSIRWNAGSYGGVPWYGVSQLPRKFADMLGAADLMVIGHGHRPAILPNGRGWLVINGALPATSNFEQSAFKSVHRPLQWLMSMHEEHGLTGWKPVYLDVPGTMLPGEVWDDPEGFAAMANARA